MPWSRANFGACLAGLGLPSPIINFPVFQLESVLVPLLNSSKVIAQMQRLQVDPVVQIIQEEAQLMVDVRRSEILRCCTQQHYLVLALLQIPR